MDENTARISASFNHSILRTRKKRYVAHFLASYDPAFFEAKTGFLKQEQSLRLRAKHQAIPVLSEERTEEIALGDLRETNSDNVAFMKYLDTMEQEE